MTEGRNIGLKVNDADNVATMFCVVQRSSAVDIQDNHGDERKVTVLDDIPYGHKIALQPIEKADAILKYGEQIGIASRDIAKGEHVHVHNMESTRGRGDLQNKE